MTELKPCPFCGSTDIIPVPSWPASWYKCRDCYGSRGTLYQSENEARAAWNERAFAYHETPEIQTDTQEFDPSKEYCPGCELEVDPKHEKTWYIKAPKSEARFYWHNSCRAIYMQEQHDRRKAKGWLRRFLEWIWIGERKQ